MNDRLLSAISLCRKAGKLKMGTDVVKDAALDGSAALVLTASDLAERSLRQIRFAYENTKIRVAILPFTMEELWQVAGRRCGIYAVCDKGFAKMIAGLLPPEGDATA